MIKRLAKHGDQFAIELDRELLESLQINSQTDIEISSDGTNIILQPIRNVDRQQAIESALAETNARYSKTLKKLAE